MGSVVAAAGVGLLIYSATKVWALALLVAVTCVFMPYWRVQSLAKARRKRLRALWPDAVDYILSGVRAGMDLPQTLVSLAEHGPVELRPYLEQFSRDYGVSGSLVTALELLKQRLADPVADRVIAALLLAREVGGGELSELLAALSQMLRADMRTRAEIEARASVTVNGARLAVVAPWVVLLLMATRPEGRQAYASTGGTMVMIFGAAVTAVAYQIMLKVGALPSEKRVLL